MNKMEKILKKKEIHLFNMFDKEFAFDVNDMNLFEINILTKEVLQEVEGKTYEQLISSMENKFDKEKVSKVIKDLIQIKLIGDEISYQKEMEKTTNKGLSKIALYVTQNCNLHCKYCLTRQDGNIVNKSMTKNVAQAAIDLLFKESVNVENINISFYGGEPLLNFDLIKEIVPYSNQKAKEGNKNISYSITTNGTLLTERVIDFLCDNNIQIAISIDGDKKTHDYNRVFANGAGSFDRLLAGFTKLREKTDHIIAQPVMTNFNSNLKEITSSLHSLGFKCIQFSPALSSDGQMDILDTDIDKYKKEYEKMIKYLLDNFSSDISYFPADFSIIFKYLGKKRKVETNCSAGYGQVSISPEGYILPCDSFIGRQNFYMGHVLTGFDKSYQSIFKELKAENNSACQTCWTRNLCGGWCPYFSYIKHNDLKKPVRTICTMNKHFYKVAMAVFSYFRKNKMTSTSN